MEFWAFLGDFVVGMSFGSIWVMYLGGDVIGSYNLFFFFFIEEFWLCGFS